MSRLWTALRFGSNSPIAAEALALFSVSAPAFYPYAPSLRIFSTSALFR